MELGERLRQTLAVAGLTPRHLGGATRVYYTTIYRIMGGRDQKVSGSVEYVLTKALDKIEHMVEQGELPVTEKLSCKETTERLASMLAQES